MDDDNLISKSSLELAFKAFQVSSFLFAVEWTRLLGEGRGGEGVMEEKGR